MPLRALISGHHCQSPSFLDQRIACSNRLDLCIGKCCLVDILTASAYSLACHNLTDKTLLIFNERPVVGIKGAFGDISVDCHLLISLPCRMPRPSLCSIEEGFHGQSTWCIATRCVCTLTPVPHLSVEPIRTFFLPVLISLKSASLCASVLASWIKAISSAGIPYWISVSFR